MWDDHSQYMEKYKSCSDSRPPTSPRTITGKKRATPRSSAAAARHPCRLAARRLRIETKQLEFAQIWPPKCGGLNHKEWESTGNNHDVIKKTMIAQAKIVIYIFKKWDTNATMGSNSPQWIKMKICCYATHTYSYAKYSGFNVQKAGIESTLW